MVIRARKQAQRLTADSRVPRYLQVASVLRRRIRDGHWPVGAKIATLEEMEREFGVARVTVRQAIDLLQGEGLVKSFQGRGTFVTGTVENDRWIQLATDWDSLIAPIRDNVPHLLPSATQPAPRIEEGDGTPAPEYVFIRSIQKRGTDLLPSPACMSPSTSTCATRSFSPPGRPWPSSRRWRIWRSPVRTRRCRSAPPIWKWRAISASPSTRRQPKHAASSWIPTASVIYVGEITYPGDCVRLNIELIGQNRG